MSASPPPFLSVPVRPLREGDVTTLVDELLAEQRHLTAVEKFSQHHQDHSGSALAGHYRDLLPLTTPRPGEQYAFEVDLDRCSGCKGCVTACHALNGLDEEESWREIGFLVGGIPGALGHRASALQQTVTTACHHCVEPGCLLGCPVLAYDKDPVTGIVHHLDDQCIGCSYCILKCPYEVPQYSAQRGIVRKCDLCHGRLAEGEAPACVQACPNEAIQITLVKTADFARRFRGSEVAPRESAPLAGSTFTSPRWLPDAPDPALTLPTTRYRSRQANATLLAADHTRPKPAAVHLPLVFMLVLTQAGIGLLTLAALSKLPASQAILPVDSSHPVLLGAVGMVLFATGLVASVFHLGQPLKAWRVWLGWRTSWLSREAIVLNAYGAVATGSLILWGAEYAPLLARVPSEWIDRIHRLHGGPMWLWFLPLLLTGSAAVWAQTMVYADTGRRFWRRSMTGPRFAGTTLLLGLAGTFVLSPSRPVAGLLGLTTLFKLALEISVLKHAQSDSERWTQLRRTAVLQLGPLRAWLGFRLIVGLSGGILLPLGVSTHSLSAHWAVAVAVSLLLGELIERALFFTSVAPDKMPGLP